MNGSTETNEWARQFAALENAAIRATETASEAILAWTDGRVSLEMEKLVEVTLEDSSELMTSCEELLTAVAFGIEGVIGGQLLLVFDEENGRDLAQSLIGKRIQITEDWSDLEQSAIMETGNILASAYLNEMTRIVENKLTPTAPAFIQDYAGSVVGQALANQMMLSDQILACCTVFEFDGKKMDWSVYFLPDSKLVDYLN